MKRSLFAATFAVVCAVSVAARATPTVAPSAKTPKRQNAIENGAQRLRLLFARNKSLE